MENMNNEKQYVHNVRHNCTCGKEWSVNTNEFIDDYEPLICDKCDGHITIAQIPEGMKFKEHLGTY